MSNILPFAPESVLNRNWGDMDKIEPEHEEFWEDYRDAVVDEFLLAQSSYKSLLDAQKLAMGKDAQIEESDDGVPPMAVSGHSSVTTDGMAEVALAIPEIEVARLRYERAIRLLQNSKVENCRWVISQVDLIQENYPDCDLDIGILVRYFAVATDASLRPPEQRQLSWYQIVPPDRTSTN